MSTTYYPFRHPITSIRLTEMDVNHIVFTVFIGGQNAGKIICNTEEVDNVFDIFVDYDRPVTTVYFAGIKKGMALESSMPDFDGYITDGRKVTTMKHLEELVHASQKEHAKMQLTPDTGE